MKRGTPDNGVGGADLADMIWKVLEARWVELLIFAAVYVGILLAIFGINAFVLRKLREAAARTATQVDDRIIAALSRPARFWAFLLAFILTLQWVSLSFLPRPVLHWIGIAFLAVLLYSVTMAVSRMAIIFIDYRLRQSDSSQQVTTLTANLVRFVVAIPAVLILLNRFEINLAPALTALGVGGIAVSLALQGTLANLFSGFWVSTAGQIHKGDYIRLDSGKEGWVEDIRWRITTLRTPINNIVIIPNSKLAEAIVENLSHPAKPFVVSIPVGVDYSSDIDLVERCLLEEAQASVGEVDGLVPELAPLVRFNPGFGDSSLNFTLMLRVHDFRQQFAITDHVRRRIFKRFVKEGLNMPFPNRTLNIAPGMLARALERQDRDQGA